MIKLTTDSDDDGQGAKSEVYRAQTELAHWQQAREDALRSRTAAKVVATNAESGA